MRAIYLDLGMGAAGDMLTAALLELLAPQERSAFVGELNHLGIPGVHTYAERVTRAGVVGTRVHVLVGGQEEGGQAGDHTHIGASHGDAPGLGYPHGHDHDRNHGQSFGDDDDHGHIHEHEHGHGCGNALDDEPEHAHEQSLGDDHGHGHDHDHGHGHVHLADIERLLAGLSLPYRVREDALAVYASIAQAESNVHGEPVGLVHFHEVGALDAVADVVAVCLLMDRLGAEAVIASPIHVGSGTVKCAHGVMPVPAPATALLLQGLPIYGGQVQGELCTPTGAALLRRFVTSFGEMPVMRVAATGYGMGARDFGRLNCVRAFLGDVDEPALQTPGAAGSRDEVTELACNVDDMSAEDLAFACEQLLAAGALDAWCCAIVMKKGRPATQVCALADDAHLQAVRAALLAHTSTLGVRETRARRCVLDRRVETLDTSLGPVRVKVSEGWGAARAKPEFDDLARIARERDLPLAEVRATIARDLE